MNDKPLQVPELLQIHSSIGVAFALVGIAAFYFFLQKKTQWKMFNFFPPLLFIYATPLILTNIDVLPAKSEVYSGLSAYALPMFICLMLLKVDVPATVRVMGSGVLVMLLGSVGIVVGGVVSHALTHTFMTGDGWAGVGTLAGSWIGGTGNMAAAQQALGTSSEYFGFAVLADNLVYIFWLPVMLGSKMFADKFNKWARVPESRLARLDAAAAELPREDRKTAMTDYLYLGVLSLGITWLAIVLANSDFLPISVEKGFTPNTWKILLVTTFALAVSTTPLKKLPGSHNIAMAIIYIFVASMGARTSIDVIDQSAVAFIIGAFIWILIHGAFCLFGAWLFRVDVHTVAIASAANVGGAASAPVVAAFHRESLVPASVLMAMIGYAIGTYLAIATGFAAKWVAGG